MFRWQARPPPARSVNRHSGVSSLCSITGAETGRAEFESHYDSTMPLPTESHTRAAFELDYVAVQ